MRFLTPQPHTLRLNPELPPCPPVLRQKQELLTDTTLPAEGFSLSVNDQGITIRASTPAGFFYGKQALEDLWTLYPRGIPALEITDKPRFPFRGAYLDITRGQIPSLKTLKERVKTLARLRYNHVQLYIEHIYPFGAVNPDLPEDQAILPGELKELDILCKENFIDFVPSLSAFGHMFEILEDPRYRHLREQQNPEPEPRLRNPAQTWLYRMRHHTINALLNESRELLGSMIADFLPNFTSPWVNVCCDETFDLGISTLEPGIPENERAERLSTIFLHHILWLHGVITRTYGKKMMIWGDMLIHYPGIISQLPKDILILNWQYDPKASPEQSITFQNHERAYVNCPGVQGWNRFTSDYPSAIQNISRMAFYAQEHWGSGLLVTDWGDWGHPNQFETSLPLFALGAALGWEGVPQEVVDSNYVQDLYQSLSNLYPRQLPYEWMNTLQTLPEDLNNWARFNYRFEVLSQTDQDHYGSFPQDSTYLEQAMQNLSRIRSELGELEFSRSSYGKIFLCGIVGVELNTLRHVFALKLKQGQTLTLQDSQSFAALAGVYRRGLQEVWQLNHKPSELSLILASIDDAIIELQGFVHDSGGHPYN